jgi:hypothetical protein
MSHVIISSVQVCAGVEPEKHFHIHAGRGQRVAIDIERGGVIHIKSFKCRPILFTPHVCMTVTTLRK